MPAAVRIILVLLLAVVAQGCATTNQVSLAHFVSNPDEKLPVVTVFLKTPTDQFSEDCQAFDSRSRQHHCHTNTLDLMKLRSHLQHAGVFEDVIFADDEVSYRLLLTTGIYNNDSGRKFGNALLSGATLTMLPLIDTQQIKVEASVYWYGFELQNYQYDIPFETRASLFSKQQDNADDIARSISSYIIRDLQESPVFTPQFLASKLESTRYDFGHMVPDQIGDYQHYTDYTFTHPFQGVQVRYLHTSRPADFVDVFIYPVRSPSWHEDKQALLKKEADDTRRDIEQAIENDEFTDLAFSDIQAQDWQLGARSERVISYEYEFTDLVINTFSSRTYLAIVEDKFIQLRHTALKGSVPEGEVEAVGRELLGKLVIPPESLFMARVRKQWRDHSPL